MKKFLTSVVCVGAVAVILVAVVPRNAPQLRAEVAIEGVGYQPDGQQSQITVSETVISVQ